MGDIVKKGTNCKDKIVNANILVNSAATDGIHLDIGDFSRIGIFSPDGFLAALDSAEQLCSNSSPSKITAGPALINDNDATQHQLFSLRKTSFSNSDVLNSFQSDTNANRNLIGLLASEKVVELNIKSRSLEEKVFSIDHVLETIFSKLDRKTLLMCRNVSPRWASFASKPLHRIVHIRLTRRGQYKQRIQSRGTANSDFSLQSLIALMDESPGFPCSTFSFLNIFTADDGIINYAQPLLNTHGHYIKKMRIDGRISLEDVKRLVFTQAPNLQQLLLVNDRCSSLRDEDWSGAIVSLQQPPLQNLKVFKCEEHIPKMFIQYILEWSPNLVEVVLPVKYLGLLVKPVNRLHLLQKLDTGLEYHTSIEAIECVLNEHEGNLGLESIHFHHRDDTLNERRIHVMNKILKRSSASCQILALDYKFDFEIPEMPVMPQVRHLSFHGCRFNLFRVNLLRKWSRLGNTFPNMRSLSINISTWCRERDEDSLYGWRDPSQIIISVKDVYFRRQGPQDDVHQRFKEMFPNATIRDSLVGETYDADNAGLQFNHLI